MILLKSVKLNNFLSHENTTIEFRDAEKAIIDGQSGAGKSSIFEGIIWALYGEGRVDNKFLVKKGSKRGFVELEIIRQVADGGSTNTIFTIIRSVTSAGKHTLELFHRVDGNQRESYPIAGIRDIQSFIDRELMGASYLLFINSVAYVQGSTENFALQTGPRRKELLLEILKAEDYNIYLENARKALTKVSSEHGAALGEKNALQERLAFLNNRLQDPLVFITQINTHNEKLKELEPIITSLEEKQSSYASLSQTLAVLRPVLSTATNDKTKIEATVASNKKRLSNIPIFNEQLHNKLKKDLIGFKQDLDSAVRGNAIFNEYQRRKPIEIDHTDGIKRRQDSIDHLKSGEKCPSGDSCPYFSKTLSNIAFYEKEIKVLNDSIKATEVELAAWLEEGKYIKNTDVKEILDNIRTVEEAVSKMDEERKEYDQRDRLLAENVELEAKLVEIDKNIIDITSQITSIENSAKGVEVYVAELIIKRKEQKDIQDAISKANIALEALDKDADEIKAIEDRVKDISLREIALQEKAKKIDLIKSAFGPKGIETIVIDYMLSSLEDRINTILSRLSDFRIRIDTQRKGADGETMIEGLFIIVCNDVGEEMPYENYSGGEKVRITFAISEALASLVKSKVGFRLIDEAVVGFDPNTLESFLNVIDTLLADFPQVFMISHIQEVKDMFESNIKVIKSKGISTIHLTKS